ncbi:pilus assembly protein [Segeticoccus rhizosphaerae]|uniref:pilus assembly protein n=1 Tax=Segeticoccus rhizosphaerae TaxID=1104777 RepID=UPI0010C06BFC|nr:MULTISPECIES: pilus assembly protein [Intrasporangiaceae]
MTTFVGARWRRLLCQRRDAGSVVVEFIVLGLMMSLPVFYLVVTLARVQAGAFAVTAASREAGRAYVTAAHQHAAPGRAEAAAGLAFADQGFADRGRLAITCDKSPCLQPEGHVEVVASLEVPLPLVPDFLGGVLPTSVSVSADHVSTVDRFRGGS